MPSRGSGGATEPGGRSCVSWSRSAMAARWLRERLLLVDLALQLDDAVDQGLGPRRTAGHEHVDRHDLVDALHDRVVVEHATDRGTGTHRADVLRFRHLVVDAA